MLPQEIIRRKRDSKPLRAEEIAGFVDGITSGAVTEGQIAALSSGKAAELFGTMVAMLGGPRDFVENARKHLGDADVEHPVLAGRDGFVTGIATRDLGLAVVALGGGRTRAEDTIDHAVGITAILPVGAEVRPREPLAIVHARSKSDAEAAEVAIREAYAIGDDKPSRRKSIIRRVSAPG